MADLIDLQNTEPNDADEVMENFNHVDDKAQDGINQIAQITGDIPNFATIFADEVFEVVGGNISDYERFCSGNFHFYLGAMLDTDVGGKASGLTFNYKFCLKANHYKLNITGVVESNKSIVEYYIDGIFQGVIDWYDAVPNMKTIKKINVNVLFDGMHILTVKVIGKNKDSTDYGCAMTQYRFCKYDGASDDRMTNFDNVGVYSMVGSFTCPAAGGNYSVIGLKFKPRYVDFFISYQAGHATACYLGVGWMDYNGNQGAASISSLDDTQVTEEAANFCIRMRNYLAVDDVRTAFVSMDSDGFTINFGVTHIAYRVHWKAVK